MKSKLIILTAAFAAVATASVVRAEEEEVIPLDKVPAAVHQTLSTYAADSDVKKVEKSDEDGKKVYEFEIQQGARKFEVSISKKGKYLGTEEDVDFSSLPDAVQKALTDKAQGGKISGTEKAVDKDNKVTYEADIASGGKKLEVTVSDEGKVLKTEDESNEKGEDKD